MRIAVVGCGAVGSYYGARLALAGHEVHFLLRSDFELVRRDGVHIRSPEGDFHVRPQCALSPADIGVVDLVLIGLKTTANHQFPTLLPPLVGPATTILTLQNGLGNEELLARTFPETPILGGLCFVCLNRVAPGDIHHLGAGRVFLGEFQPPPESRAHAIAEVFRQAKVSCEVSEDLYCAQWRKLVWNIAFNGLGVAGIVGYEALTADEIVIPESGRVASSVCLTTRQLLGEPKWAALVRELMLEVIAAARAQGCALTDNVADEQIAMTRGLNDYRASTLIDFEQGRPLELESIFLEPLRRARRTGLPMKRLSTVCAVLAKLDSWRLARGPGGA